MVLIAFNNHNSLGLTRKSDVMSDFLQRALPLGRLLQTGLEVDRRLFEVAYGFRGHRMVSWVMWLFAKSGDGPYYAALALWLIWARVPGAVDFFFTGLVAFSFELTLYFILKNSFRRARPYNALSHITNTINPLDRYSFPSGHASAAFVMATLVHAFFPAFGIAAFAWACAVGYSRVYHGIHYPADILAGMGLGIGATSVVLHVLGG